MEPTFNKLLSDNEQLSAQVRDYEEMLCVWQSWWNEHGFDWYQSVGVQKDKPPFLKSDHPMYGKWVKS